MGSKLWPKKRFTRLQRELHAYMKMMALPENGDHSITDYRKEKAGCGVCVQIRAVNSFCGFLEDWHLERKYHG